MHTATIKPLKSEKTDKIRVEWSIKMKLDFNPMVRLGAALRFINECVPDVLVQFITVFIFNSNTI